MGAERLDQAAAEVGVVLIDDGDGDVANKLPKIGLRIEDRVEHRGENEQAKHATVAENTNGTRPSCELSGVNRTCPVGASNVALRSLLDELVVRQPDLKVLALHDFDVSGMGIAATLVNETRRYAFQNDIDFTDLGLRLTDIAGLQAEPVKRKARNFSVSVASAARIDRNSGSRSCVMGSALDPGPGPARNPRWSAGADFSIIRVSPPAWRVGGISLETSHGTRFRSDHRPRAAALRTRTVGRELGLGCPDLELCLVDLGHRRIPIARLLVEVERLVEGHFGMARRAHADPAFEQANQVAVVG